jgi:hypothetical protein
MGMDKMTGRDSGTVTIDLLFAVVLVIGATMAAFFIMPNVSHEDRDWRVKQYMSVTRATDNLVQDGGEPDWWTKWDSGDYSNVTKIGLLYVDADGSSNNKIISQTKVEALMGQGYENNNDYFIYNIIKWWEFPNPETTQAERDNAARALGLTGSQFYMQLHPVALTEEVFDPTPLETNLTLWRGRVSSTSAVERYVYINDPAGKYLKYKNTGDKFEVLHYRLYLWVW